MVAVNKCMEKDKFMDSSNGLMAAKGSVLGEQVCRSTGKSGTLTGLETKMNNILAHLDSNVSEIRAVNSQIIGDVPTIANEEKQSDVEGSILNRFDCLLSKMDRAANNIGGEIMKQRRLFE